MVEIQGNVLRGLRWICTLRAVYFATVLDADRANLHPVYRMWFLHGIELLYERIPVHPAYNTDYIVKESTRMEAALKSQNQVLIGVRKTVPIRRDL